MLTSESAEHFLTGFGIALGFILKHGHVMIQTRSARPAN